MYKLVIAAFVSVATLGLGACADNRPAGNAAYASADDDAISAHVKARLAEDSHDIARNIRVATMNGEVELSGFTATQQDKENAEHIAMGVSGVQKVHNDIVVNPNGK
jgi:hyperosmotically inducible protein